MTLDGFAIEKVDDFDAVLVEVKQLFLEFEEYNVSLMPGRRLRTEWEARWRELMSTDEDHLVLIARVSGEPVGYLAAGIERDFGLTESEFAYIADMFVKKEFRGRAIGRTLIARAQEWIRLRGVSEMRLDVWAVNKLGLRFWTLSGFELQSMTMRKALV